MSWLDRAAIALVRLQGRAFAASYGDDILATLKARGDRARRRGRLVWLLFAARETISLLVAAITANFSPQWQSQSRSAGGRGFSPEQARGEFMVAARRLRLSPTFGVAAILTLALSVGSVTTTFALVWRIVVSPLPYPSADRLIALDHGTPGLGMSDGLGLSIGLYREYSALRTLEAVSLFTVREGTLSGNEAARTRFVQATPEIAALAGLEMQVGRWFSDEETTAGGPNVVVLTHGMWRQYFGGTPAIVGQPLRVDGTAYEVIGVLKPQSQFPDPRSQFFMPLPLPRLWTQAAGFNYSGLARLAPGVTLDHARREQDAVIAGLRSRYPSDQGIGAMIDGGLRSRARTLQDTVVGNAGITLWAMFGAAAIVFLMACANLANLFLVRHESRLRELAVQRALGAGAWNLAAGVVCETALIAAAGGALALAMARAAIDAVITYGPQDIPRLHELTLGGASFAFGIAVSLAAAAACAALPLMRLWTNRPASLVSLERNATPATSGMRTRHALMGAQIMMAVLLLCASGLMTQSFRNLLRVDPGFDPASKLAFDVSAPRSEYRTRYDAALFQSALLDRIAGTPGIVEAAAISNLPLEGLGIGDPLEVRGRLNVAADAAPIVRFRRVSVNYFSTMNIAVKAGRLFDLPDSDGRTDSAVVDEALVRLYFGNGDPIGQRIRPVDDTSQDRWLTIIGVVGNTATESLSEPSPVAKLYVPLRASMWADVPSPHDMTYIVRSNGDPMTTAGSLRASLARLNPRIALARPEPLDAVVSRARASRALTMFALLAAAIVAAGVGIVGIYAVVSYAVAQRRTEIGVRIALGATPAGVTRMIVLGNAIVVAIGICAGIVLSLATGSVLRSLLFGVAPTDWAIHGMVAASALIVAIAACWLPASRATRTNPITALRGD